MFSDNKTRMNNSSDPSKTGTAGSLSAKMTEILSVYS